jgi:ABC-2 type transport system permease protein
MSVRGNFVNVIAEVVRILAITYIWYYTGAEKNVYIYLLVGQVFKSLGEYYFYNRISDHIISGKITSKLVVPTSNMQVFGIGGIGYRLPPNIIESISPILALVIFQFIAKVDILGSFDILRFFGVIILFIPIAFCSNYFIGYSVGSLAFFIDDKRDIWGISTTATNIISVLRGTIVPLDKIPLGSFISFLPLSYSLHHPMQIYLGKYSTTEIFYTFLGGIAWCFVLWILARVIFKLGLKKNEAVGL